MICTGSTKPEQSDAPDKMGRSVELPCFTASEDISSSAAFIVVMPHFAGDLKRSPQQPSPPPITMNQSLLKTESADLWHSLQHLMNDFLLKHKLGWKYQINLDVPKERAYDQWLIDCMRNAREVDQLVDELIEKDTLQLDDSELRYFLFVRFAAASELVNMLAFLRMGQRVTLFRAPSDDPKAVLRALLTEWWQGMGIHTSFYSVYDGKLYQGIA